MIDVCFSKGQLECDRLCVEGLGLGWYDRKIIEPIKRRSHDSLRRCLLFGDDPTILVEDRAFQYVEEYCIRCGDGVVQGLEECDQSDADGFNGDGCDEDCQIEDGWTCSSGNDNVQLLLLVDCTHKVC